MPLSPFRPGCRSSFLRAACALVVATAAGANSGESAACIANRAAPAAALLQRAADASAVRSSSAVEAQKSEGYVARHRSTEEVRAIAARHTLGRLGSHGELSLNDGTTAQIYSMGGNDAGGAANVDSNTIGLGTLAPLTEQGYQQVVDMGDDREMEFFIRRVVNQLGLRIRNQGGLAGLVKWYSGEIDRQSLKALEDEIMRISQLPGDWVTGEYSGASAPLDEEGYAKVAAQKDNREMSEFVRRAASDMGYAVKDEEALQGLAQWHSGVKGMSRNLATLRKELAELAAMEGSWLKESLPCSGIAGHPYDAEVLRTPPRSGVIEDEPAAEESKETHTAASKKRKKKVSLLTVENRVTSEGGEPTRSRAAPA